jgi:hypothetical protein
MGLSQKSWIPMLGIPVVGLLWSLTIVLLNAERLSDLNVQTTDAFLLVSLGGLAQISAIWVGFSAVTWAMIRGFGGRTALLRVLIMVSAASIPLWFGAPLTAYWLFGGDAKSTLIGLAIVTSLLGFIYGLGLLLAQETGWPMWRSLVVLGTAVLFLSSFTYLNV